MFTCIIMLFYKGYICSTWLLFSFKRFPPMITRTTPSFYGFFHRVRFAMQRWCSQIRALGMGKPSSKRTTSLNPIRRRPQKEISFEATIDHWFSEEIFVWVSNELFFVIGGGGAIIYMIDLSISAGSKLIQRLLVILSDLHETWPMIVHAFLGLVVEWPLY